MLRKGFAFPLRSLDGLCLFVCLRSGGPASRFHLRCFRKGAAFPHIKRPSRRTHVPGEAAITTTDWKAWSYPMCALNSVHFWRQRAADPTRNRNRRWINRLNHRHSSFPYDHRAGATYQSRQLTLSRSQNNIWRDPSGQSVAGHRQHGSFLRGRLVGRAHASPVKWLVQSCSVTSRGSTERQHASLILAP